MLKKVTREKLLDVFFAILFLAGSAGVISLLTAAVFGVTSASITPGGAMMATAFAGYVMFRRWPGIVIGAIVGLATHVVIFNFLNYFLGS